MATGLPGADSSAQRVLIERTRSAHNIGTAGESGASLLL
jgi:hypothetical protein